MGLMTTGAVCAAADSTALALAIVLSSRSIHHNSVAVALVSLHDDKAIAASLLPVIPNSCYLHNS